MGSVCDWMNAFVVAGVDFAVREGACVGGHELAAELFSNVDRELRVRAPGYKHESLLTGNLDAGHVGTRSLPRLRRASVRRRYRRLLLQLPELLQYPPDWFQPSH